MVLFLKSQQFLCISCVLEQNPQFIDFKIDSVKGLAIYEYTDKIKEELFKLKGCFDIELAPIFLYPYHDDLYLLYYGYVLVPMPSYFKDDEIRGFNHVEEIFKYMKLPIVKIFTKNKKIKQSDRNFLERKNIINDLEVNNLEKIVNKKVLLVDDVCTTGSTLNAAIKLLKNVKLKDLKILVVSRRILQDTK